MVSLLEVLLSAQGLWEHPLTISMPPVLRQWRSSRCGGTCLRGWGSRERWLRRRLWGVLVGGQLGWGEGLQDLERILGCAGRIMHQRGSHMEPHQAPVWAEVAGGADGGRWSICAAWGKQGEIGFLIR
jgi:hypothetical protein